MTRSFTCTIFEFKCSALARKISFIAARLNNPDQPRHHHRLGCGDTSCVMGGNEPIVRCDDAVCTLLPPSRDILPHIGKTI